MVQNPDENTELKQSSDVEITKLEAIQFENGAVDKTNQIDEQKPEPDYVVRESDQLEDKTVRKEDEIKSNEDEKPILDESKVTKIDSPDKRDPETVARLSNATSTSVDFVDNLTPNVSSLKKSVKFDKVNVFMFERCLGYSSMPVSDENDDGENPPYTLGMKFNHECVETFSSLDQYLKYKRKCDLDKLENYLNSKSQPSSTDLSVNVNELQVKMEKLKSVLENKKYYEENVDLELNIDPDILCPILNTTERKEKLFECGVDLADLDAQSTADGSKGSADENEIKNSRRVCGCQCKGICGVDENCSCFANGINCQLDRIKFPCSCSVKRCHNPFGLKRFDFKSVMQHTKSILGQQNADDALENVDAAQNDDLSEAAVEPKATKLRRKRKRTSFTQKPSKKKKIST